MDSERCFAEDPAGVAETVTLLAEAGAGRCSIEDYDPHTDSIDDVGRRRRAGGGGREAAHEAEPMVLTARAENHLHGVDDLDDTIGRLVAYRDAGADVVYAPGRRDPAHIARVVEAVGVPVNVLALPGAPSVPELEQVGVRRVSTGSLLASAAYGALIAGAASSTTARPATRPAASSRTTGRAPSRGERRADPPGGGVLARRGNEAGYFGVTAFVVGKREIGHLHGERTAHFAFPKRVAEELRAEGRIGPHPVFPDSVGMAARSIEDEADVDDVIALLLGSATTGSPPVTGQTGELLGVAHRERLLVVVEVRVHVAVLRPAADVLRPFGELRVRVVASPTAATAVVGARTSNRPGGRGSGTAGADRRR